MPPRIKTTKEDIIKKAVDIVRESGADSLNARSIAAGLECSTQPIFSNFNSMEELKIAVVAAAEEIYRAYIVKEISQEKYPPYKASGMAYIRFAREEKELFKILFMRDRSDETFEQDTMVADGAVEVLQRNTGLSKEEAAIFHLEMWAYVHGIAAMSATGFLELEEELISRMLTDSYLGMRKQYQKEA